MGGKSVLVTDNLDAESNAFCRLCVEYTTEQTLFVSSTATATLFKRIFECTGVRLIESPGLPKQICDVCTSQLVICERFIKKCREAEQKCVDWRSKRAAALIGNLTPAPVAPELQPKQECNTMVLEKLVNVNPTDGTSEEALYVVEVVDTHQEYEIDIPDNQDVPEEGIVKQKKKDVPVEIHIGQNATTLNKKENRTRVSKTQCPECGKMQQNLKQHMLVHTGEKRHVCPYCSKAFSQKGNLTHHINQHTGNAPYKCDQCGKAFTDPQSLRSHKLVHTDERRYSCEECGDTFKYKNSHAVHLRGHNQDRRFSCDKCRRSFISSTGLKKHMRTHTGERPYPCTDCNKTFKTSSNLSLHKLLHTKERRFQCDICERWFSYKHVLKTHMNIHLRERNGGQTERLDDIEGIKDTSAACDEPCPPTPKHYSELGCKPVLEEGQCCPKRYQCPELTDRDGNKCYFNGNIYNAGAKLAKADQDVNSCSPACFCSNDTQPASFKCASIDCPEFFDSPMDNCVNQYTVNGCCADRTVCGAERDKLAQCYLEGEQYYEGQRMYPRNETCTYCFCRPGFDNSTFTGNRDCYESNCGIELHAADKLAHGCIPIYYGNARCCPILWKCPSDNDTVLVDGRNEPEEGDDNPEMQCKFGKLTLNKGDGVSSDNECVECKCTIPPLAHCIQRENC